MVYGRKQASNQTFKHTHTHAQCRSTSVGLAQTHPNQQFAVCSGSPTMINHLTSNLPTEWLCLVASSRADICYLLDELAAKPLFLNH